MNQNYGNSSAIVRIAKVVDFGNPGEFSNENPAGPTGMLYKLKAMSPSHREVGHCLSMSPENSDATNYFASPVSVATSQFQRREFLIRTLVILKTINSNPWLTDDPRAPLGS
ncbi:MAG: hypothetical protein CMJ81_17835 [Planctomycetaceae bacterium]|nr:hypothetical protein [Planctomycetaceae bacterium]